MTINLSFAGIAIIALAVLVGAGVLVWLFSEPKRND
jgi:hypothetical protein